MQRKDKLIKILLLFIAASIINNCPTFAQLNTFKEQNVLALKTPGNPATNYELTKSGNEQDGYSILQSRDNIPVTVLEKNTDIDKSTRRIEVVIYAEEDVYFNYSKQIINERYDHRNCKFLMPGFWYRQNLRSPDKAPSFRLSDSWQVREDRLSTPLTGIFSPDDKRYISVVRKNMNDQHALAPLEKGEVILSGKTSIGFTGFTKADKGSALAIGFPYWERPHTYIRKLTLDPEVKAFEYLKKGETKKLIWEIKTGEAEDFADFVKQVWEYSYDTFQPEPVDKMFSDEEVKEQLTKFYKQSYMETDKLDGFSGIHITTEQCEKRKIFEVGFIGRMILNAFNALEFGEQHHDQELVDIANGIFNSYLEHGFNDEGFFKEFVNYEHEYDANTLSIRRQSEGAFAALYYLNYEKYKKRKHPEWEAKIRHLLDNFVKLQRVDFSLPRKFDPDMNVMDDKGGSSPCVVLPLVMGYKYFNDKTYLEAASNVAKYLEREIISKSDYFSSTLDANCEDKEASIYTCTALYYLSFVTKGDERQHYIDLANKAAYFALSWYYMYDVPFAKGQMLGDIGLKSRGWGNVSVENNHIDVYIFEFAHILEWLAKEKDNERFSAFAKVIKSSMKDQLLPYEGHMCGIGKEGYYPEVVQHTKWDYGKNGKGFYNDIFAPGWTVASLWELLSPHRTEQYFNE